MKPREIVIATLEHAGPERIPATQPQPYNHDIITVRPELPGEGAWQQIDETRWERKDAWGNTWGRVDPTSKGEITIGALETLDNVDTFPLPPLDDEALYNTAKAAIADNGRERFMQGAIPGYVFSIARKLRKLDQYFMDLVIEKEKITILHDRIEELLIKQIELWGRLGVDGIGFAEDWGTQEGLFISPDMWREEFKPRFTRLSAAAHDAGLKVLMHSCGRITDVVPDMMEAGIDAFQFDQPTLHGLDVLGSFSDRATFWSPVDIQKTLQTRDKSVIQAEAKEMIAKLWHNGGFIAGYYGDNASIGLDPEVQDWACEAFRQWGSDLSWLKK